MAQRIVTLCDVHQRNDEDVAGAMWQVTMTPPGATRATTWEVDLCEDDGKTLRDLAVMLDSVGRVTDGPRRKVATAARKAARTAGEAHAAPASTSAATGPGEWACPIEGCPKVPSTRPALQSHLRAYHDGMSMAEAMGEPLPYECPECGKRLSHATGLGAHRRASHGVQSTRAEERAAG